MGIKNKKCVLKLVEKYLNFCPLDNHGIKIKIVRVGGGFTFSAVCIKCGKVYY